MQIPISLSTDSDGFITQQCDSCSGRFKIIMGEGSDQPIAHCPYCGFHGLDCWWTPEQARYIEEVTEAAAHQMMQKELEKSARKINSMRGGLIKMKMTVDKRRGPTPSPPEEMEMEWPDFTFQCCGERIKHDESEQRLYCVICGTETSIES